MAMLVEGLLRKNHAGATFGKSNNARYFVAEGFTVFVRAPARGTQAPKPCHTVPGAARGVVEALWPVRRWSFVGPRAPSAVHGACPWRAKPP